MQGEKVWADGGHIGDQTILHRILPGLTREFKRETARGRARHETINGRFTNWSALRDVYRHDLSKYYLIFGVVAIFTQIEMLHGFAPFQCFSQHDSVFTDSLNKDRYRLRDHLLDAMVSPASIPQITIISQ
jgi:hypothetical protein